MLHEDTNFRTWRNALPESVMRVPAQPVDATQALAVKLTTSVHRGKADLTRAHAKVRKWVETGLTDDVRSLAQSGNG
jgi:hypothetical protein